MSVKIARPHYGWITSTRGIKEKARGESRGGGRVSKLRLSSPDDLAQLDAQNQRIRNDMQSPTRAFLPKIPKAHISRFELELYHKF